MCEHCYKRQGKLMCEALALHNQEIDRAAFVHKGWRVTLERVKRK